MRAFSVAREAWQRPAYTRAVSTGERSETRAGIAYGVAAYALWGAMPVYFLQMRPAGPFEIVGWRILFSLVFCALLIVVTRSWVDSQSQIHSRRGSRGGGAESGRLRSGLR